jgi:signal transduction histidine kinase
VEDLRTEKRFSGPSLLIDHGVISGMSVIIGKPDRPYGVLGVHSTEKRLFTESDINFLQAVAHVLSSAIESKHANDQILQSREQLRNLASELQVAREEERTRISREIHDELGQNLTGLRIDLKWMLDQLPKKNKDLADRAQIALLLADKTLDSVQKLSQELRPSVLDDLGLEPAIKWQINEFIRHTACHCNLEMNIRDLDTNDKRDTNVFRVLQEALTNIMRHAEASQVNISLQTTNGRMLLEILDNGRGITTDKLDSSNSIGLIGMRERAIELGGHIEIQCQQSGGTLVQLDIPLQRH